MVFGTATVEVGEHGLGAAASGKLSPVFPFGVSGLRDGGHYELAIGIGSSVSGPASPDAPGKGISGLRDVGHSERTSIRGPVGSQSGRGVDVGEHGLGSGIAIGVSGLRDGGHSDLGISGRVGSNSGPAVKPGEHGLGAGAWDCRRAANSAKSACMAFPSSTTCALRRCSSVPSPVDCASSAVCVLASEAPADCTPCSPSG